MVALNHQLAVVFVVETYEVAAGTVVTMDGPARVLCDRTRVRGFILCVFTCRRAASVTEA
jgi:hypothetical protein